VVKPVKNQHFCKGKAPKGQLNPFSILSASFNPTNLLRGNLFAKFYSLQIFIDSNRIAIEVDALILAKMNLLKKTGIE